MSVGVRVRAVYSKAGLSCMGGTPVEGIVTRIRGGGRLAGKIREGHCLGEGMTGRRDKCPALREGQKDRQACGQERSGHPLMPPEHPPATSDARPASPLLPAGDQISRWPLSSLRRGACSDLLLTQVKMGGGGSTQRGRVRMEAQKKFP